MKQKRLSILLLFVTLAFALAEVPSPSLAKWLWTSEKFEASRNQVKLFRQEFEVNGEVKRAVINWVIDDIGKLTLNGNNVEDGEIIRNKEPRCSNVTPFLKPGKNAIACDVNNRIGVGGVIAHLEIEYVDGHLQDICTNADWRML